jgi:hypothetical protein
MTKYYRFLLLSLMVTLILSACGGGETTATSTSESAPTQPTVTSPTELSPTPTSEPAPEQPTEEAPADSDTSGEGESALSDLLNLSSIRTDPEELSSGPLQSYRLRAQWVIEAKEGSDTSSAAVEIEVAHTSDPLAEEMSFFDGQAGASTKMIHIGDRLWLQAGDQWIEVSSDEMDSTFDDMLFGLDSATTGLGGDARLVGEENVSGVATRHYAFDESILGAGLGLYSRIKGDVWVAVEGDYAVKYVFTAEDDEATYRWDWEVYDINAPFTIEPPADAQGAREDIPLMPDATDRSSIGAITTYQTASDLTTVTNFYIEEMPAQGWSYDEGSSLVSDEFTMLFFTKESETVNITLALDEAGGTAVVIQVGE